MGSSAAVGRAGYYRHWQASAPRREETALRDAIQPRLLAHRHDGYRRVTAWLRQEGWVLNHKRVERLRREGNLPCPRKPMFRPATMDSNHRFTVFRTWRASLCRQRSTSCGWQTSLTSGSTSRSFIWR
jgi:putative transposase